MQTKLENYVIECFDLEKDYLDFIKINGSNITTVQYHGRLFGTPQNVRDLFQNDLIQHIRRNVYHNTDYIIIHQ